MSTSLKLLCHPRYDLGERKGLSRRIYVLDEARLPELRFESMCSSIDEAINVGYLQALLADIESIEKEATEQIEEATEGWSFTLAAEGVRFEGEYGQGSGGEVSLAQFKLALQTFLQFMCDPEHRPVEVDFPEH